jgi:hypothetical protein
VGATIGRQFAYELLQAVSPVDEKTLQREIGRLVDAELVYQRGMPHGPPTCSNMPCSRTRHINRCSGARGSSTIAPESITQDGSCVSPNFYDSTTTHTSYTCNGTLGESLQMQVFDQTVLCSTFLIFRVKSAVESTLSTKLTMRIKISLLSYITYFIHVSPGHSIGRMLLLKP